MIDISEEIVMPIEQARLWLGERLGTAPSRVTVERWIKSGIRGVVLETIKVGGKRYTSREAINRFVAGLSGGVKIVSSAKRRREIEAARVEAERVFGGTRDATPRVKRK